MKLIIAFIKPFKLEQVRDSLKIAGVSGMSVNDISARSWAASPSLSSFRPRAKPGVDVSTSSRLMPRRPASGSVLTASITRSASAPLEMNVLAPFTT